MDSSRSWSRFSLLSGLFAAALVSVGGSGTAHAADPAPSVVFDARRALPLFPSLGYRDGFFLENSLIGGFGLHIRAVGIYGRDPLGSQADNGTNAIIGNRFTLHAAAIVSLAKIVELGLTIPFVLYQDSSGFNLNTSAIGDLRLIGKVNLHLPKNWPQLALSVGLGFETASSLSALGAGGISGYPRLIIDMPRILDGRIQIAANAGAVIAGITRPCTAEELAAQAQGNTTPGTGMMMPMMSGTTECETRALGLGDHFLYGLGVSALLSRDQSLFVTSELIGSVSVGIGEETRTPLFWDVGIRRARPNGTFFSAAYGIGLTTGSPSHTVLVSLGLVWEAKDAPPPAKAGGPGGPTLKLDINITGLPPGSSANVGGKDIKVPPPAGSPAAGGPSGSAPKPAGAAPASPGDKPPPPKPITGSMELAIPEGLIPAASGPPSGGGSAGGPPKKK